jgi:hypothetical protein
MRMAKNDVPVKVDAPGATARQMTDFGDATGYGTMGGEYFSFTAGTDITPLLEGLEGNLCQTPHWGYIIEGGLTVTFSVLPPDVVVGPAVPGVKRSISDKRGFDRN